MGDFNTYYRPHYKSLYTPKARWLMFAKLITTDNIEEFKDLYFNLTTYKEDCTGKGKYYERKNLTTKKLLESF